MTSPNTIDSHLSQRLDQAFEMMDDLVESVAEADVAKSLSEPSNSIWSQIWCVVGARESYASAIGAGEWQGFNCSLTAADRDQREPLAAALSSSANLVKKAISKSGIGDFGVDLLLHESQHQGQLIRYLYGLGLQIPESWKTRWNL